MTNWRDAREAHALSLITRQFLACLEEFCNHTFCCLQFVEIESMLPF